MNVLDKVISLLDEKKAIDITAINIEEINSIASYIVIVTANSSVHSRGLAGHIISFFKQNYDFKVIKNNPDLSNPWILIDAQDILINVFLKETREFYSLEKLYFKGDIYYKSKN